MHDGVQVEFMPEPKIECEIMMRRHQVGIVIGALGVDIVTARRLHTDNDTAEAVQAEVKFARDDMRVLLRFSPSRLNGTPHVLRQSRERSRIIRKRPRYTAGTRRA